MLPVHSEGSWENTGTWHTVLLAQHQTAAHPWQTIRSFAMKGRPRFSWYPPGARPCPPALLPPTTPRPPTFSVLLCVPGGCWHPGNLNSDVIIKEHVACCWRKTHSVSCRVSTRRGHENYFLCESFTRSDLFWVRTVRTYARAAACRGYP